MRQATSHTQRRREMRRAQEREAVLAAASRLFAENGYNETGMTQIAEAVSFSVGKLYNLFENKEDLFVSLVDDRMRRLVEAGAEAADPNATCMTQLRQRVRASLEYFAGDPHFSRIFHTEYPATADGLLHRASEHHVQIVQQCLDEAMAAAEIPREDARVLATLICAHVNGLIDEAVLKDQRIDPDWVMTYLERFMFAPIENHQGMPSP
ncbi:TetR family transcriptional regulator [bacterium]|nr:TetR family transcriptional regulator [bacterium]